MKKNPPSTYNLDYLQGPMSHDHRVNGKLPNRWDDNGLHMGCARLVDTIAKRIGAKSILDVGCGRGWVVKHLRNHGYRADGIEYGEAALANSVCGATPCDLTERLQVVDNGYDLVISYGVLSHIPADDLPNALGEIARVAKLRVWTNIRTQWGKSQQHHLTFLKQERWRELFAEAGLVPDPKAERNSVTLGQYSQVWIHEPQ